jgi:prevent-host-death family protein
METVGAYEAKTHLPKLLEKVARGEKITITRHGSPVAVLQQPENKSFENVRGTIEALRRFRANMSLGGFSIRELMEEGRR